MNDWLRGIAGWLGFLTTLDAERIDAERDDTRRRVDRLEARVDVLELMAANVARWPRRRDDDADHRRD